VAAVAAVLSLYQDWVIRVATDPRTGIGTVEPYTRYMPNPGELKLFCDNLAARAARLDRWRSLPGGNRYHGFTQLPPDPHPGPDGRHPPGTILANYSEAVRLYGKPVDKEGTRTAQEATPNPAHSQPRLDPTVTGDPSEWAL
jgi:hypothetical protein